MCSLSKLCIFAGTTEGRRLAELLCGQPLDVTVCVATDYGEQLMKAADNLHIHRGRMDQPQMERFFEEEGFSCVVDATHPYAQAVTQNISAACRTAGVEYIRLLRDTSETDSSLIPVSSAAEAAEYLTGTEGNILLTTGSKELSAFASLAQRIYARVLPMENSLRLCQEAGIEPSHIIAMQGPFSTEMNTALLKSCSARFLVTKEGGRSGGFEEKLEAARQTGTSVVVIGRPLQEDGLDFSSVVALLRGKFDLKLKPSVSIVGIGPGSLSAMTAEVRQAIAEADCLIGAKRMLEAIGGKQAAVEAIAPQKIADSIQQHPEFRRFTVLMSGDSGFFSGTKKLLPLLKNCEVQVLPGLSSLSCLCARLGESYEDVVNISLHGREHDIVPDVKKHRRIFTLVGGENGMGLLCRQLCEAGLGHVKVSVGEQLSYPDEKITVGTAAELAEQSFHPLSVALLENTAADPIVTHGLPDELFQRGSATDGSVVPMTKMEVRSVALSKLQLTKHAVCWDIGAGTGSVAIEMALQTEGSVYAVERKEDAIALLKENVLRFGVSNLEIISGLAPDACAALPAPSHVFIGGSAGNMKDILACVLAKNPHARIVATAIALESVAELTACMKDFDTAEVVQLSAARSRKAGPYHLMNGQNPVYIFTLQKGEC